MNPIKLNQIELLIQINLSIKIENININYIPILN